MHNQVQSNQKAKGNSIPHNTIQQNKSSQSQKVQQVVDTKLIQTNQLQDQANKSKNVKVQKVQQFEEIYDFDTKLRGLDNVMPICFTLYLYMHVNLVWQLSLNVMIFLTVVLLQYYILYYAIYQNEIQIKNFLDNKYFRSYLLQRNISYLDKITFYRYILLNLICCIFGYFTLFHFDYSNRSIINPQYILIFGGNILFSINVYQIIKKIKANNIDDILIFQTVSQKQAKQRQKILMQDITKTKQLIRQKKVESIIELNKDYDQVEKSIQTQGTKQHKILVEFSTQTQIKKTQEYFTQTQLQLPNNSIIDQKKLQIIVEKYAEKILTQNQHIQEILQKVRQITTKNTEQEKSNKNVEEVRIQNAQKDIQNIELQRLLTEQQKVQFDQKIKSQIASQIISRKSISNNDLNQYLQYKSMRSSDLSSGIPNRQIFNQYQTQSLQDTPNNKYTAQFPQFVVPQTSVQIIQKTESMPAFNQNILMSKQQQFPLITTGTLFKKSQFLSKWEESYVRVTSDKIEIYQKSNITKILFEIPLFQLNKIKLLSDTYKQNFIFRLYYSKTKEFAANLSDYYGFPLCYAWFASLLTMKFKGLGVKLDNNQIPVFYNIQKYKQYTINQYISGVIQRKGAILGNWERQFVVVNKTGIYAFKNEEVKPNFVIKRDDLKYIWTRFEYQNDLLIIKVKHGALKTQLKIPLVNFLKKKNNWILAIYRLIIQNNY